MPFGSPLPDEQVARQIAVETFGLQPIAVRRFPAGLMHYVYDVSFDARASVVVRIAAPYGHAAMRGASQLSRVLRPRGVPLPALLAQNLDGPFPYLILERLPGVDLGVVIGDLSQESLEAIAAAIVEAQAVTSRLPTCERKFGYAISSKEAPYSTWSDVLNAHLERSRKRIAAAGVFDPGETEMLSVLLKEMEEESATMPATPFLHDTTTKNVIVSTDGRFSGIVDVDDLCFGDPRYVVALTQASLLVQGAPLDYAKTLMRLARFSEDRLFRTYVALFLADFMSERGHDFNRDQIATQPGFDQQLRQFYLESLVAVKAGD